MTSNCAFVRFEGASVKNCVVLQGCIWHVLLIRLPRAKQPMSHQSHVPQSTVSVSWSCSCRQCGKDKAVPKWWLPELMLSGHRQVPEEWLQGANPVRLLKGSGR